MLKLNWGRLCEVIHRTFVSCCTPINFLCPIKEVLISDTPKISLWTLSDREIPPIGAKPSTREAIFTSSPNTSPSFTKISPWWIPILIFNSSIIFNVSWISIEHLTASRLLSKLNNKPSPISFSHSPLCFSTIGLMISFWFWISSTAFCSS